MVSGVKATGITSRDILCIMFDWSDKQIVTSVTGIWVSRVMPAIVCSDIHIDLVGIRVNIYRITILSKMYTVSICHRHIKLREIIIDYYLGISLYLTGNYNVVHLISPSRQLTSNTVFHNIKIILSLRRKIIHDWKVLGLPQI